jgi:hypothetical protein
MLARTAWGVGVALDSDDVCLGRLQAAAASKTSSTAICRRNFEIVCVIRAGDVESGEASVLVQASAWE